MEKVESTHEQGIRKENILEIKRPSLFLGALTNRPSTKSIKALIGA
jgi:hypothetical protein